MKRIAALSALLSVVLVPSAALADSATSNVGVSANVSKNCLISATPLSFVGYDPVVAHATANLDVTGGLSIACTKGLNPGVTLNGGSGGSVTARRMVHADGSLLNYGLFSDQNRSDNWGSTPVAQGAAESKQARTFTIYGRINGGQDVPSGSYSDTIIATVQF
jgi:spore coat protein U domain-containing protein, fimbrial subunit CupE1/2/3/6